MSIFKKHGSLNAVQFDKALNVIKECTENNDHTGSIIEGCKFLGIKDLELAAKIIQIHQERDGYLTHEISYKRRVVYENMLLKAKELLTPNFYEKFYMCF